MKLGAITPVYNEENLINGCIKCLEPFVDNHIVLVSDKPYFGENEPPDNTAKIAEDLGANVINGYWSLDHEQRNTGISLLQDYDWIICTDVDMWLTSRDLSNLIEVLDNTDRDSFVIPQISYWKDIEHTIVDDDFMPVIAIRPNVRFTHIGCIDRPATILNNCVVHHINWCEPKNIYKKVTTYSHSPEFDGKTWYKEHYETWNDSMDYAVLPNKKFKIKKEGLPNELRKFL